MSDVSSDLGGIRAGPVERDIEQVRAANPSLGGSISPHPFHGSTAGATEMWMGRSSSTAYVLSARVARMDFPSPVPGSTAGATYHGQIIVHRLRALRPRGAEFQASSCSLCADVKWCLIPAEFMGVDAVVCCYLLLLCYSGAQTGYFRSLFPSLC
jgi:hypothetical protein